MGPGAPQLEEFFEFLFLFFFNYFNLGIKRICVGVFDGGREASGTLFTIKIQEPKGESCEENGRNQASIGCLNSCLFIYVNFVKCVSVYF